MLKILKILKKIVFSLGFMYTFNIIFSPLNIYIPINICTILLFCFLGVPSIFYVVILKLML